MDIKKKKMSIEKTKEIINNICLKRNYKYEDEDLYKDNDIFVKIFYCLDTKLNIDILKNYIQYLEEHHYLHGIIIHNQIITSSSKKILENMVRFYFETFHLDELQFDITQHILYCPHSKLNDKKKKKINKDIFKNLPILLHNDPICKYFDFRRGDIIKIQRKNGIIIYRIVK